MPTNIGSSETSDHVVFKSEDKQAKTRRKWLRKQAGILDTERTQGKKNVLNTPATFKQTKTPKWMIKKANRIKKTKEKRDKQKAILRQQKAYRKAKAQKLDDGSLATETGEAVANLKFLDFHQAFANSNGLIVHHDMKQLGKDGTSGSVNNALLAELHKMTKDEYVASEFARKVGEKAVDSSKVWEADVDKGDSTANIKEEELVVDDDGNAYESLPELFHGFHHNVVKQNNNTTEESLLLLSPLQQAELEQKEKEKDRITTDIQLPHNLLTETGSNLPNLTPPNSTSKRRKRSESVNPFPEFMEDEPIANHHVDPGKLQTLSFTEQRQKRKQMQSNVSKQPFDMSLPVKNMRILKPQDFSICYLSHCTVRDGRSPFFYHQEYKPPKYCCLGNGKPRHTFSTIPMLCKNADPTTHSNPTWGEWNVERTIVIRDFVSEEEACMFAAQNRITNIFPGAQIPKLHKAKAPKPHASNNALMKGVKKKKKTKAEKKAAKLAAKIAAEEEAQRIADEKAAEEKEEVDARPKFKSAHVEVSLTINDYGVVLARKWHDDECVLILKNGKVLGICREDPCWVPACEFKPIEEMQGHYVLQASWARGKWRALDRNGESLIFKVPRPVKV